MTTGPSFETDIENPEGNPDLGATEEEIEFYLQGAEQQHESEDESESEETIISTETTKMDKLKLGSLGDVDIVDETDAQVDSATGVVYSMQERKKLEQDKLQDLFRHAAERRTGHKYEIVSVAIDDPDTLKRTYMLGQTFATSKQQLTKYDMINVFTIVKLDKTDPSDLSKATMHDLFTEHTVLTREDIAASNRFYATRIKDSDIQGWMRQNLTISAQYFENNCTTELRSKVNEQYRKYKSTEQGGPLFFKIMAEFLVINSRDAVTTLLASVRALDISKIPGEDVGHAVSLISGTYDFLKNLESIDSSERIPKEFTRHVLQVLQTTSNSGFNLFFQTMEATESCAHILRPQDKGTSVDKILECATSEYNTRVINGTWDGVKAKKNETKAGFTAAGNGATERPCFNCGSTQHKLDKCTKPKDDQRIEKARQALRDSKRQGKGSGRQPTGKWAPPTEAEKKNRNKRTIDGKPMFYHYKTKRWMPDKFANEGNVAQTTPQPAPAPAPAAAPAPASAPAGQANITVDQLNALQTFKSVMKAFSQE